MHDMVLCTASKIRVVTVALRRGLRGCPSTGGLQGYSLSHQNDICSAWEVGTPDAPVSKITSVIKY
jgi:hypothetical protein